MFRRSGVYVGWVGFGNLGDEAMWQVCQQRFPRIQWSTMNDLTAPIASRSVAHACHDPAWLSRVAREELHDQARLRLLLRKCRHRASALLAGEVGLLGGGTFINRNQSILDAYTQLRKKLKRPIPVFGTGVANSAYWSGTKGWSDHRKQWTDLLDELPVVGVRGPLSKAELDDYGLRNVIISGDPALLLHEPLTRRESSADRLTIAFNFGEPAGGMIGSGERVAEDLATVAREVARRHRVKFIPIWPQDAAACQRLAQQAGLPASSVTPPCLTHTQFRYQMQDTDFLVAFKLHAGILAAACNVPFVLYEYQPKCRDFMASAGWSDLCVHPANSSPEFLLHQVERAESCGNQWREEINKTITTLAQTFEAYCRTIEPLLSA
jgi:polysaccharide pyruvyl transferase WcaK-like protein